MMKKFLTIAVVLLVGASAFAFSFGKKSITGTIQIYGSAPMTFVGFVTDKGEKYSLDIDAGANFTIKDITAHQGEPLKLTGVINKKELFGFQTLENGRFVVSKYKVLKK